MNELLQKISSYNLFNYLIPGVIFATLSPRMTGVSFAPDDLLVAAFVYYFVGLVISRFGSVVIEPILMSTGFVKYAPYKEFIRASKEDSKIELLSEINNSFRTFCSTFVLLLALKVYTKLALLLPSRVQYWGPSILALGLVALFAYSYKKQTAFVRKRVEAAVRESAGQ